MPSLPKVTSRSLLVGVLEAHEGTELDDPAGELLAYFGIDRGELNEELRRVWVEQVSRFDPSIRRHVRLDEFPPLSVNVSEALAHASRFWKTLGPGRDGIPLRFVFGGMLQVPGSGAYRTLAGLIGDVDLSKVAQEFPQFLSDGKDAHLTAFLEDVVPGRPARSPSETQVRPARVHSYSVGTTSDRAVGRDVLGRDELAHHISRWLAAKNLQTPLAVGLFGVWGSGKSFFMGSVQSRIRELTERSASVEPDESAFCTNIAQVNFNAWFHSGAELWPSLATQVFRSVGGVDADVVDPAADARRRRDWAQVDPKCAKVQDELKEAAATEAAATKKVMDLGGEIPRLEEDVARKGEELKTGRGPSFVGRIAAGWRGLHPRSRQLLILLLIVLLVALIIGLLWREVLSSIVATLGLVAAGVGYVAKSLAYTRGFIKADRELSAKENEREEEQKRAIEARDVRMKKEQELEKLATGSLISTYASVQASRWEHEEHRGVVSEVRRAFEGLSERIEAAKNGSADAVLGGTVDRVIVYIDDLDRCESDVVVHVLETVKLLMDLPHFVVVVGVDSRWLARAIETHFDPLIGRDRDETQRSAEWASMPQDYLEKIFQFSLVLPRMSQEGYQSLVGALLEVPPAPARPHPPQPESATAQIDGNDESPGTAEPVHEHIPAGDDASTLESATTSERPPDDEDLQPTDLLITPEEKALMQAFGTFIETPRSAKRLTNVYRLFRVIEGEDSLLKDKSYEPALLLFGIVIGFPRQASDLLKAIASLPGQDEWESFAERLKPERRGDGFTNVAVEHLPASEVPTWTRISESLPLLRAQLPEPGKLERFQEWVPSVACYTFNPWQEIPITAA